MVVETTAPVSAGESAYARIRTDIVCGRIAPGQKLRLESMREVYGVGIGTLREILSRLSAEALVLSEGQRGFEVPPVRVSELRELGELRLLLECRALADSFAAGDVEWEGRVVAAHHKLEVSERRMIAGGREEAPAWKRYDWEFHQALISACGSRALMAAHAAAFDRYLRYLMIAACFRGEVAAREHRALRDSALARDSERACRVLREHIGGCVGHVVATTSWPA
jgi:DNA-binding GntR family transcriptional regulator